MEQKKQPCHFYHLKKCNQGIKCKYSHEGLPSGKCIYGLKCKHCGPKQPKQPDQKIIPQKQQIMQPDYIIQQKMNTNPGIQNRNPTYSNPLTQQQQSPKQKCHFYHLGTCIKQNCQFSHQGKPLLKCIVGPSCSFCKPQQQQQQQQQNNQINDSTDSSFTSNFSKQTNDTYNNNNISNYPNFRNSNNNNQNQQRQKFQNQSQNQQKNERKISNNKDQKTKKPKENQEKICHNFSIDGKCSDMSGCKFSHNQITGVCNFKVCNFCCHDYQLNGKCEKQSKGKCKKLHLGTPSKRCIFGNSCMICNKACHQYQLKGYCKKKKYCKFDHEGAVLKKCPFGGNKWEQLQQCHFMSITGNCKSGNKCQYSHKVKKTGRCVNIFCGIPKCRNNKKQKKCKDAQKEIDKIASQINDHDIFPDQLKASELVQDNKILKGSQIKKNNDKFLNSISFNNLKYNSKDMKKKMAVGRKTMKQALGFNYQITKGIKAGDCKGDGVFTTVNGDQGKIQIQGNKASILLNNQKKDIEIEQPLLVNMLVKDQKYYNNDNQSYQTDNSSADEEEEEVKDDKNLRQSRFKNTKNKKSKLQEQNVLFIPEPLNIPVIGNFQFDCGVQSGSDAGDDILNPEEEKLEDDNNYTYNNNRQQSQFIEIKSEQNKLAESLLMQNSQIIKSELQRSNMDFEQLQNKRNKGVLEICFLMDTTSSMQPYIDKSRETITKIIQKIGEKFQDTKFKTRYSFIGYKDHGDADIIKKYDFIDSTLEILQYITTVKSSGGRDLQEAVLDGIDEVFKLDWNQTNNLDLGGSQRLLFHILDAPPHGKEFNKKNLHINDNYPEGCPCKLNFNKLSTRINNMDISYHMIAIEEKFEDILAKTIQKFDKYIQSFNHCIIKDYSVMTESVIEFLSELPFWKI